MFDEIQTVTLDEISNLRLREFGQFNGNTDIQWRLIDIERNIDFFGMGNHQAQFLPDGLIFTFLVPRSQQSEEIDCDFWMLKDAIDFIQF
jgi:hypothetical protein